MENNDQLKVKYHNITFVRDFLILFIGIVFCSFVMSVLSWLITYDSNKLLTIHQVSQDLSIIQLIIFICLTITIEWLNEKEKILKEKVGIKEDDKYC